MPFLDKITSYLESRTSIKISGLEIDHICYRCDSVEEYLLVTRELTTFHGKLLVQGMIGGRPISTIVLNEPIAYKHWKIPCVEVPCPKKGRSYKSGLEHAEVVIGSATSTPFESKESLLQFVAQHSSPDIQFDCRAIDKHINADVSLSIDDVSIKFHLCGLKEVCLTEIDSGEVVPVPEGYFD